MCAPFPATDRRRHLLLIAAAAAVLNLSNLAWDVLGPLWTTAELGLGADDWARLRSLRFTGTLIGTVMIGLAAGVWGARTVGAAAFVLAGGGLGAIAWFGNPALALALPVFGAAVSAVYISLNTLTQQVEREHQARANAVYRSVGAGVACVAPLLATAAAGVLGYANTLGVAAVVLGAGGVVLWSCPRGGRSGHGFQGAVVALLAPLRRRDMRRLILIEQAFCMLTSGGAAFTTLVLARSLGLADRAVGTVLTLGASAAFAGTLLSHRIQSRLGPIRAMLTGWLLALAGAALLATADGAKQAAVAVLTGGFAAGVHAAPTSFAVARLGGAGDEAQTFTIWKIVQGLALVVGMQLCAALEPRLGMTGVIAWGAAAALVPVACLWRWSCDGVNLL